MENAIKLTGVRENNLKSVDVEIPYHKHTVIAGVSGSGKSTLAYDVIYAAAQRKLLDCMSDQDRRFGIKMKKPDAERIEGLSTVISLKQIKPNNNPRSTVGTYTGIGSCVRTLLAVHGQCRCLFCDNVCKQSSLYTIIKDLEKLDSQTVAGVCFPYFFHTKTERKQQLEALRRQGNQAVYINGERHSLKDFVEVDESAEFIMVEAGRFQTAGKISRSAENCLKNADAQGDHYIAINLSGEDADGIRTFYQKHGCAEHHLVTLLLKESDFSYNNIPCACPACMGSGMQKKVHPSKVVQNAKKTLRQGPFFREVFSMSHPYSYMTMYSMALHYGFSFDEPYEQLSDEAKELILYGTKGETFLLRRPEGYDKPLPSYLAKENEPVAFTGVLTRISDLYDEMLRGNEDPSPSQEHFFKTYMHETPCSDCGGTRLKKIKNYITLCGKNYTALGKTEFSDLYAFLETLDEYKIDNEMSRPVIAALRERLTLMNEIGLDYLTFERRVDTLSGGEYQRLRIANQAGSGLVGLTYVIDEPTDGLHGSDNRKVLAVIDRLLDKGGTVITIEHDRDVIGAADYIVELGPGAGTDGGEVVAAGTLTEIKKNPKSVIAKYLLKKPMFELRQEAPDFGASIRLSGVAANNVKNVDVEIPLGRITCFAGVSGSGKSTVVYEVLYKALCAKLCDTSVIPGAYRSIEGIERIKNIVCIDQNLLQGKRSSIPATYLDIFDGIRTLFAQSAADGSGVKYDRTYFSFRSKGACPECRGLGYIAQYIQYFGETRMACPACGGRQYTDDVLQVRYHGRNIKQVLDMTFAEAMLFFDDQKAIRDKAALMCELGLGYMQLGQSLSTVSGGEARRLKLVREMSRYKSKKDLLYIFDEPTIGLHAKDVSRILAVMRRIVAEGNTVVFIEHDPEMILSADYIVDMGPGGGKHGGKVVFRGTPSQLLLRAQTKTAAYLRAYLGMDSDLNID